MSDSTTTSQVRDVSVLVGCILCGECEHIAPEIFSLTMSTATVRSRAEQHYRTHTLQILQAARECPAQVIRVAIVGDPSRFF